MYFSNSTKNVATGPVSSHAATMGQTAGPQMTTTDSHHPLNNQRQKRLTHGNH
jgi:hypothetical protein